MHVSIVGAGAVGVAVASSILHARLAARLTLYDAATGKAEGEALDFAHVSPLLGGPVVEGGPAEELVGGDLCVVTAGAKQRPGETRLALAERNAATVDAVAEALERNGLPRLVLVVTNPVDVITWRLARRWEGTGVVVCGSGTLLDTMRLRACLASRLGISGESVHATVIGEHGESAVCLLDGARAGGLPIPELCRRLGRPWTEEDRRAVERFVRDGAQEVIRRKGATSHAIGLVAARIVRAVAEDERAVLPLSVAWDETCAASVPCLVSADGVRSLGTPELSAREAAEFERSLEVLRRACAELPP